MNLTSRIQLVKGDDLLMSQKVQTLDEGLQVYIKLLPVVPNLVYF